MISLQEDTIVALATPNGIGAIGVIRLSGPAAITIVNSVFYGKDLTQQASHTIHFGTIRDGGLIVDEVLVSLFVAPKSYTKENVIEISCHGSNYIIQSLIKLFVKKGARLAKPGEYTLRAFLNGGLDLAQAEAVADLIAANSEASHQLALQQMRGGYSDELKFLREKLIHFASMIELELDFGEEDVEFANREDLRKLILQISAIIHQLIQSFDLGNVLKNGVPVVIAGKPNVGKSTLLNALLNEDRAIVSEIAGTTRDAIEDEITIQGINFRFIDTAGIRETEDIVEAKGVERTFEKIKSAAIVIYVFDPAETTKPALETVINDLKDVIISNNSKLIVVANKSDIHHDVMYSPEIIHISAKQKQNLKTLEAALLSAIHADSIHSNDIIITNIRHLEALKKANESLEKVMEGITNPVTSDFLAMDIKQSLHYIGEIVGEVTTDDLLENIFSKFCIGK